MKDLSKEKKEIKDSFNLVKHLVSDIRDNDDKEVIVTAQTPLRKRLGLPPMEIKNSLAGALKDLKTISDMHAEKEKNGIS